MNNTETKELTKAELEVMKIVWEKNMIFLADIVEGYKSEDKPAYTTISTIVRILVKKGFLGYETFGKTNRYYSIITKEEYRKNIISNTLSNFFNNSPIELISYFAKEGSLSAKQYQELQDLINKG